MRTDETGQPCPATLGEYRDTMIAFLRDDQNPAVRFLDDKIAEQGRNERVLADDSQMRVLLFSLAGWI